MVINDRLDIDAMEKIGHLEAEISRYVCGRGLVPMCVGGGWFSCVL